MSEIKPKIREEKKGYRPLNKYELYDDMIRKAMEPCRKSRRYSS